MSYLDRTNSFVAGLGAEAWLVGGAVRDSLIQGRRIHDADYIVRMDLKDLKTALRKTGADFGPLALRTGKVIGYRATKHGIGAVEIALPRVERKTVVEDGNERHNFEIVVDPNVPLVEDAIRRDFTINAIYKNAITGEIADPLGGVEDIEAQLIRTTHPASFSDDPLRILRALRFVSVLGFNLAGTTLLEMDECSSAVTGLTGKGVSGTALDELQKILMGRYVGKALRLARDTGVLTTLLPELAPMVAFAQDNEYHDLTIDEHTFTALDAAASMDCSLRVRFALLFHDAGKPAVAWKGDDGFLHYYGMPKAEVEYRRARMITTRKESLEDHAVISARLARKALKRLNADSKLRRDVPLLIERHMVPLTMRVRATKVRRWRCELGDELLADLFKHRLADCAGKSIVKYEDLRAIERLEHIREDAVRMKIPASAKDLKDAGLIDGHDLIEMGIPGPQIGEILAQLLHEIISNPERARRPWLLGRAKKLAGKA